MFFESNGVGVHAMGYGNVCNGCSLLDLGGKNGSDALAHQDYDLFQVAMLPNSELG